MSSIVQKSLWRLLQLGFQTLWAGFAIVVLVKTLPKEQFGIYAVLQGVCFVLQGLTVFGMSQTATRNVANSLGRADKAGARGHATACVLIAIGAAVVILAIGTPIVPQILPYFNASNLSLVLIGFTVLTAVTEALCLVLEGVIIGAAHFGENARLRILQSLTNIAYLGALVLLDAVSLVAVFGGGAIVNICVLVPYFLGSARHGLLSVGDWRQAKYRTSIWFGFPLAISFFAGFLYTRVDIFFLGYYGTQGSVANYAFVVSAFDVVLFGLSAFVVVLGQEFAVRFGAGDMVSIRRTLGRSVLVGGIVGALLSILAVGLAPLLIPLFFPKYADTVFIWQLLFCLLCFKIVGQIMHGSVLVPLGRVKTVVFLGLSGGVLNVVLNLLLIPLYLELGAIISTIIGHSLSIVATVVVVLLVIRTMGPRHGEGEPGA